MRIPVSSSANGLELFEALRASHPALPLVAVSVDSLGITERQRQVLARYAQGKSNKQICRELGLAEATVKIHVTVILRALKVTSRTRAVVMINQLGLRLNVADSADGER